MEYDGSSHIGPLGSNVSAAIDARRGASAVVALTGPKRKFRRGLGDKEPPPELVMQPTKLTGASETAALPSTYDPFASSECLDDFMARDQGRLEATPLLPPPVAEARRCKSRLRACTVAQPPPAPYLLLTRCLTPMRSCGCCYAFASATMFSLNYCLAAEAKGISISANVLAVQGLVSCGSVLYSSTYTSYTYTYACDGAYAQLAMEYLIDVGLAWSSCVPYASGGSGDYSSHYDAVDEGLPDCAHLHLPPRTLRGGPWSGSPHSGGTVWLHRGA